MDVEAAHRDPPANCHRDFNLSMTTGAFPYQFKRALVTPLLKQPSLDVNVLKNYRPVSNLPYISRVTEKVVAARLLQHVQENGMQERMQPVYRAHQSTETVLVKVSNDLLCPIDQRKAVILILLDPSAAFQWPTCTCTPFRSLYGEGVPWR